MLHRSKRKGSFVFAGHAHQAIQRYIKRQVEKDLLNAVLRQANFNPVEAKIRLN